MKYALSSLALAGALALVTPFPAIAQQPGQLGPAAGPSQGVQIQGSSLIGSTVRASDGKDLGKVHDVMVDAQDGKISSVVISMGGTLGMGGKQVTVPWSAVRVARDQQNVIVTLQQEVIPTAPRAQDQPRNDRSQPAASPPTSGASQPPAQTPPSETKQ
jgi:sporulation protein YlmC with PRC-barrel domain